MFDISSVQLDWQGLNLKLETGLIARQADGAVIATLGSTRFFALYVLQKVLILQLIFSHFPFTTLKRHTLLAKYQEVFLKGKEDHQKLKF